MRKNTWFGTLCLFLFLSPGLDAASPDLSPCFYGTRQNEKVSLSCFPNVYAGTHRNGAGANAVLSAWLPLGKLPLGIGAELDVNGSAYLSNFGLPGPSGVLETGGTLRIGWGKASEFGESPWLRPGPYRHAFASRYSYYFATDGTTQPYADFRYELNISNKYFIFRMGNDGYAAVRDGFRSAAGDITVYINKTDDLFGFSTGFKLWHGDYSEQCYLSRGQIYDFSHIAGKDHTLGLIYASFSCNRFEISLGCDSDRIRVFLQNTVHTIQNNGRVPAVDRADKIFIELSLCGNSGQY
ncbi:MAG: polymorphic toxin type 23 domain-containing protein [Candidatus Neomarinimicrobiota bacterium]|jgi:hypothetical protein|nr:polymorphic toxin type 23 domain-containing protein [bacterium]